MNRLILKNLSNFKITNFYISDVYSRNYSKYYNTIPLQYNLLEPQENEKYKAHVNYIVDFLVTVENDLPKIGRQRFKDMLNFNLPAHREDGGPFVITAYKHFAHPEKQTPENIDLVYTMAWVNNLILRYFHISDDILDACELRANKPCWHKMENIGLNAVNDTLLIGEATSVLVTKHLFGHPSYLPILELTNNTKFQTALGQMLDSDINFANFNIAKWKITAKYKATIIGIIDPIVRGMYLAEVFDKNIIHSEMETVYIELGEYLVAQNDMLDCYGDPTITGKNGSDIKTGKCTWLAVKVLEDANTFQRELFLNHYGRPDEDSQKLIYDLFSTLNILEKFLVYEENSYKKLYGMVDKIQATIPKANYFYQVVDTIYGKLKN